MMPSRLVRSPQTGIEVERRNISRGGALVLMTEGLADLAQTWAEMAAGRRPRRDDENYPVIYLDASGKVDDFESICLKIRHSLLEFGWARNRVTSKGFCGVY